MSTFIKIFIGFWLLWIIWYLTGGPLRDNKTEKYIKLSPSGILEPSATPGY